METGSRPTPRPPQAPWPAGASVPRLQEYTLVGRHRRPAGRRRDPQARHLPDHRQPAGGAHPGERRRRLAIGMTFVIATGGHRPVGRFDRRRGRHRRRAGDRQRRPGSSSSPRSASALLLGAVNAMAIACGRVVPFIATLAMLAIARGLALQMSDKTPISLTGCPSCSGCGSSAGCIGVPVSVLVFLAVTVAGWVLLNRTALRPARRRGRRQPGGRSDRRRPGPPHRSSAVYCLTGLCVGVWRPSCCRAGWPAPRRCRASCSSWTPSAPWSSAGPSLAGGRATMTGTFFGVIVFAHDLQPAEPSSTCAAEMAADRQGGDHPRRRAPAAPTTDHVVLSLVRPLRLLSEEPIRQKGREQHEAPPKARRHGRARGAHA